MTMMRQLDPTAQCSMIESDRTLTAFAYEWPDLRVVINVMPGSELPQHLQGFVGFIRQGCARLKRPVDDSLERRILSTTFVLGFVVERKAQPDCWQERVQNMIGTIAFNTGSLVFWEGRILDEHAKPLFP
jgi:hypothetical protein